MTGVMRLHAERTADPRTVRWVVRHPTLTAAGDGRRSPDPSSALGALVASGEIDEVCVVDGHVHVRAVDAARWSTLAAAAHRAITTDLADDAAWLGLVSADQHPVSIGSSSSSARVTAPATGGRCNGASDACGQCSRR